MWWARPALLQSQRARMMTHLCKLGTHEKGIDASEGGWCVVVLGEWVVVLCEVVGGLDAAGGEERGGGGRL